MKRVLFICFWILLFNLHSNGQLQVDAGNDVIVCSGDNQGEYKIGGSPTASGGVEPYSYSWSGKHFDLKYPTGEPMWIFASDIMDDTTKSNPVIKDWRNVSDIWTTYYLKVEDAAGNVQVDSFKIIQASFLIKTIYKLPQTIYRGDSIQLFGDIYFTNNFLPLEYTLSPSHGLKNQNDLYGWAKPDTSITYYLQAINSVGCVSEKIPYWKIEIIDTTTNLTQDLTFVNRNLQFYPNPAKNKVIISNPLNIKIKKIELIDFTGRIIQEWKGLDLTENELNFENVLSGIYFLKSETLFGIKTEKLIVE